MVTFRPNLIRTTDLLQTESSLQRQKSSSEYWIKPKQLKALPRKLKLSWDTYWSKFKALQNIKNVGLHDSSLA